LRTVTDHWRRVVGSTSRSDAALQVTFGVVRQYDRFGSTWRRAEAVGHGPVVPESLKEICQPSSPRPRRQPVRSATNP
jgi:hypothetical protein